MKNFIYLLLASLLVMTSCTETRYIEMREFTVKKVKGAEKWAFPNSNVFYDEIIYDSNDDSKIYIGRIGDKKWLLDSRGNRVIEEPLLTKEMLGTSLYEVSTDSEVIYYRFTTAKGVYFGNTEYGLEVVGGPYEDLFMLDYGAYLYKINGKWAYFPKGFPAEYDALIQVDERTAAGEYLLYFICRKGKTWSAVDLSNKPFAISQSKIRQFLAIKPNPTNRYKPHQVNSLYRERLGNDEAGQILIRDGKRRYVGAF